MGYLKSCPCCGGDIEMYEVLCVNGKDGWRVAPDSDGGCAVCRNLKDIVPYESYREFVEAWNTRYERTTRIVHGSEGKPFGENIIYPLTCEACGYGISVSDNYCRNCGARVKEGE